MFLLKMAEQTFLINNIIIDGKKSDSLPTTGTYNMSASCQKGSELSWDPISKTITYNSGSKCYYGFCSRV